MIFQKPLFEHSMIYVRRKRWDLGWCGSLGLQLGLFQQITFLSHTLALLLVLESNCLCVQVYCVFSHDKVRSDQWKRCFCSSDRKKLKHIFFYITRACQISNDWRINIFREKLNINYILFLQSWKKTRSSKIWIIEWPTNVSKEKLRYTWRFRNICSFESNIILINNQNMILIYLLKWNNYLIYLQLLSLTPLHLLLQTQTKYSRLFLKT